MNLTHPFLDLDGDKLREECGIFGAINAAAPSSPPASWAPGKKRVWLIRSPMESGLTFSVSAIVASTILPAKSVQAPASPKPRRIFLRALTNLAAKEQAVRVS